MNELAFQKALVDAAIEEGGHAFKCNNQFMVGVADLSVKLVGLPHVYLEAKRHNTFTGVREIGLTPHQRKFLKDYRAAGGISGWATFAPVKGKRDCYEIRSSGDLQSVQVDFRDLERYPALGKERGGTWPIRQIVINILQKRVGE